MNGELKLDCQNCIDDVSLEITIKGKTMPTFSNIMRAAREQGWRIGRDCYCPACYQALPAHCDSCEHFEGNKSMGAALCRLDGEFATATDYCKHHTPSSSAY